MTYSAVATQLMFAFMSPAGGGRGWKFFDSSPVASLAPSKGGQKLCQQRVARLGKRILLFVSWDVMTKRDYRITAINYNL